MGTVAGSLHVSNTVLADLIGNAALECYGVVGMAAPSTGDAIVKLLPSSRLRRGILISSGQNGARIDLYVVVEYGTAIPVVIQNLIDRIKFVVDEYTKAPIDAIEVHVVGVKVRG